MVCSPDLVTFSSDDTAPQTDWKKNTEHNISTWAWILLKQQNGGLKRNPTETEKGIERHVKHTIMRKQQVYKKLRILCSVAHKILTDFKVRSWHSVHSKIKKAMGKKSKRNLNCVMQTFFFNCMVYYSRSRQITVHSFIVHYTLAVKVQTEFTG